jgi:hypothetical protein
VANVQPSAAPTHRSAPDSSARPTRVPSVTSGAPGAAASDDDLWTARVSGLADDDAADGPIHIVYVLADDVGWNDFGYQSTDLGGDSLADGGATPTMDALARDGIILDHFYAMATCTPARSSLMSGVDSIHTGMTLDGGINAGDAYGLPLRFRTLPQYLRLAASDPDAFRAHGIGKWDIGHFNEHYVPTKRGFDSWYGYYSSFVSYLSHVSNIESCVEGVDCVYDWCVRRARS